MVARIHVGYVGVTGSPDHGVHALDLRSIGKRGSSLSLSLSLSPPPPSSPEGCWGGGRQRRGGAGPSPALSAIWSAC